MLSYSLQRLTRSSSDQHSSMRNSRSSVLSTVESEAPASPVPVVGRRIIPREQIDVQSDIGQGEFGVVRHAIYTNDVGQKVSLCNDRWDLLLSVGFVHIYPDNALVNMKVVAQYI